MPRGLQKKMNWEHNGTTYRTMKELCQALKISPATVHRSVRGLTTKPSSLHLREHPIKKIKQYSVGDSID